MTDESMAAQDIPEQNISVKRSSIHRLKPKEAAKILTDLGLGFGIDATSRDPWTQKSVWQVCRIREPQNDVVIIDKGANWRSFHQKVESHRELQGKLSASVTVPNTPVSIAAGLEVSRKTVRSREVFGRRLVDCNASLRPRLSSSPVKSDDFEAMLSSWIVDRIHHLANVWQTVTGNVPDKEPEDLSPADVAKFGVSSTKLKFAKEAVKHKKSQPAPTGEMPEKEETDQALNAQHIRNAEWEFLVELCREFVSEQKVTHYISSLELGVAEYQTKEVTTQVNQDSVSGGFSLYQSIQASASVSSTWKNFSDDTHTLTCGVIKGGEIERLAVLDVSVLPITDQVKTSKLQMALQQGLARYFEEYDRDVDHQFEKGPFKFRITIPRLSNYYLYVHSPTPTPSRENRPQSMSEQQQEEEGQDNVELLEEEEAQHNVKRKGYSLLVTTNEEKASPFFLVPVDEKEADEFYIVFYHEELVNIGGRYVPQRSEKSIPYYLCVNPPKIGWQSTNCFRFSANPTENSKFRFLRSGSFNTGSGPSLIKAAEEKPIYIQCPQYWLRSGYVCMLKNEHPCMGWYHAIDRYPRYFLFNLIPVTPESQEQDGNTIPDPASSLHRGQGTALSPQEAANVTHH